MGRLVADAEQLGHRAIRQKPIARPIEPMPQPVNEPLFDLLDFISPSDGHGVFTGTSRLIDERWRKPTSI
jgi:hypothetical protein